MTSRSDINKRFHSQKIILKFTEASETKPKNIKASTLTLLMKNQTVLKWTQSTLMFMDESQCSVPTGYQFNSLIFYARFPKTCIHK